MEIVKMNESHVASVAAIEKECFGRDAWSEKSVSGELTNALALWLVAVEGETVAGYVGSQTVCNETDMMNVAVTADFRRQGIGEKLVTALVEELKAIESHSLTLEVRASNTPAQALYEKLGFAEAGRRPRYYQNPKEDALILRKEWEI